MISRAKTLDGEIVEGCLIQTETNIEGRKNFGIQMQDCYVDEKERSLNGSSFSMYVADVFEIEETTLEYQIGDEWYSIEELKDAVECLIRGK